LGAHFLDLRGLIFELRRQHFYCFRLLYYSALQFLNFAGETGTICKHVEHIFGKLNVENRTAAAVVALETYRSVATAPEPDSGQRWAAVAGFIATEFFALWSDSFELCDEIARLVA
jgi:hypothetical protein